MCGIGGLIGAQDEGGMISRRLLAALRHRGPDDEGLAQPTPTVSLVHTRLSIFDLSPAGHQPMTDRPVGDPSGLWLVFNGEIYNFKELESELAPRGRIFRTRCDSEAILHSYREWGEAAIPRWRGMFAIALIDPARGVGYLVRDRLGIKPMFTCRLPGGALGFASEMRSLMALGPELVSNEIEPAALESFFAQGAVHGYSSLIKGVTILRPGEMLRVDLETGKELRRATYWHLPAVADDAPAPARADAVEQLRDVVSEALKLHLASDVPLGLFLSGGIDSSALLALATKLTDGAVRTLTIGFDSPTFDESEISAATASRFGVDHQNIMLTGASLLEGLPDALAAIDQPTVDGFNTYFVSKAAREAGLTVALSGLGGDELFGGYATFADVPRALALRENPLLSMVARLGSGFMRNRSGVKLAEACRRPADALAMYLLRREMFLPAERRTLMPLPAAADDLTGVPAELLDEVRSETRGLGGANRISFFELNLYMRHMLLRDSDVASMAAPIEYRVPFLDHRMVEGVFSTPQEWKLPDPRPKPLLLDIAGAGVPSAVWQRAKRGFTFPWGDWFAGGGALNRVADDAVNDAARWRDLGIDAGGVRKIWNQFSAGDRRITPLQILAFVVLRDFATRHKLHAA
ncbi:MAG TPA: asparagine synthase (glutamine-hydrolyzing) [Candidatus Acidoferrales bacterium]|nr:asparagine synthase (glutamine-hydrolyzing) [Candidatus Acidoferrales bacterium]